MNRTEIVKELLLGEDHEKVIEAVAWARGRGPDSDLSTQRFILPKMLGNTIRDAVLAASPDQTVTDAEFAKALQQSLKRFDPSLHMLLKWWVLLTIVELGVTSDETLEDLLTAAEKTLEDSVARAAHAFAKGDAAGTTEGFDWTCFEFSVVAETLRAVARFRSSGAVTFLAAVCRGEALRGRQALSSRQHSAMCALGAIGTPDAQAALVACRAYAGAQLESTALLIARAYGQHSYDEFYKLTTPAPTTPSARNSRLYVFIGILVVAAFLVFYALYSAGSRGRYRYQPQTETQIARPVQPASPEPVTPPPASSTGALESACYPGVWQESPGGAFSWTFALDGGFLRIRRNDGFVSGTFTRSGDDWSGSFSWGNGESWPRVVLHAANATCDEIRTNQAWWYTKPRLDERSKSSPPSRAGTAEGGSPSLAPPLTVTIPAETVVTVRLEEALSAEKIRAGEIFIASLDSPIVSQGLVIAERGAQVEGRVLRVDAGLGLLIEVVALRTSDGQRARISTTPVRADRLVIPVDTRINFSLLEPVTLTERR